MVLFVMAPAAMIALAVLAQHLIAAYSLTATNLIPADGDLRSIILPILTRSSDERNSTTLAAARTLLNIHNSQEEWHPIEWFSLSAHILCYVLIACKMMLKANTADQPLTQVKVKTEESNFQVQPLRCKKAKESDLQAQPLRCNKAGETRAYVRHVAYGLERLGLLRDVPDLRRLPDEYWKFRNVAVEEGKKKRSPEFLADTSTALKFAQQYFRPEALWEHKCPPHVDLRAVCRVLQWPALQNESTIDLLKLLQQLLGQQQSEELCTPSAPGSGRLLAETLISKLLGSNDFLASSIYMCTSLLTVDASEVFARLQSQETLAQMDVLPASDSKLLCFILGNQPGSDGWFGFWQRHGALMFSPIESYCGLIQSNWLDQSELALLATQEMHEVHQCMNSGITHVMGIPFKSLPKRDTKMLLPLEDVELIDIQLAYDLTQSQVERKSGTEMQSFMRMVTSSLLDSGCFRNLHKLKDLPADCFSGGKDRNRLCATPAMAQLVAERFLVPAELTLPAETAAIFVAWVHFLLDDSKSEPDIPLPVQPQRLLSDEFGSGYQAAIELLAYFGIKLQPPSRFESMRLQHSLLCEGMHRLREWKSAGYTDVFLVIFQSCTTDRSDDPFRDHLTNRQLTDSNAVGRLQSQSTSISSWTSPIEPNGQYMVCNVRSSARLSDSEAKEETQLRSLLATTLFADPAQFEAMNILYVVNPSELSSAAWKVTKIETLRHLHSQLHNTIVNAGASGQISPQASNRQKDHSSNKRPISRSKVPTDRRKMMRSASSSGLSTDLDSLRDLNNATFSEQSSAMSPALSWSDESTSAQVALPTSSEVGVPTPEKVEQQRPVVSKFLRTEQAILTYKEFCSPHSAPSRTNFDPKWEASDGFDWFYVHPGMCCYSCCRRHVCMPLSRYDSASCPPTTHSRNTVKCARVICFSIGTLRLGYV
jgi:hypothetical protein